MGEVITVYNWKQEPVQMRHVRGDIYEQLDDQNEPTGTVVNLKTAFECQSYFEKPKKEKKRKNRK